MKYRVAKALAALALVTIVSATSASAQVAVDYGLGGGISVPLGTLKDAYKTGWNGLASVQVRPLSSPFAFQLDAQWQQLKQDSATVGSAGKLRSLNFTADLVYNFPTAKTSIFAPYLIGGIGLYNLKSTVDSSTDGTVPGGSASTTKFGINAGAGFNIGVGNTKFFAEGRFHDIFKGGSDADGNSISAKLIPITVGVRIGT